MVGHVLDVDAQASNPPGNSGLVQACWTVGLLAAFLRSRFRLDLSPSSVRRHLKALTAHTAPRLSVLSYNEIVPTVRVETVGLVSA